MIEASRINSLNPNKNYRSYHLAVAVGLMIVTAILGLFWLFFDESTWRLNIQVRFLPWIGATAVVLIAPAIYQIYKGKFDLFHPLIHACWSYWFPSFVVGGLVIVMDVISPYQLTLLGDPESNIIWSYIYLMISFASMTLGFYLPLGRRAGEYASRKIPAWNWEPQHVLLPSAFFLIVGSYFFIAPFLSGIYGIPMVGSNDPLSTLSFTLAYLSLEAGFLAAMFIFKSRGMRAEHLLAWGIIGFLLVSRISLTASRGSVLAIVIILAMSYFYSGRKMTKTVATVFAVLTVFAVIIGIIYGTTFRYVKGSEEQLSLEKQIDTVGETLDTLNAQDNGKILADSMNTLAERIDGISTVAVVVGNYERLKPYEADYGLENNIFTDFGTAFIPRFIWNDKPLIFDARAYSDLYFNFNGNSYALTPTCDLLRNFGPFGIPVGMILAGIFLRFVYAMLIENQKITVGRATAYYLFLLSLSYEGFYATIFIYGFRVFIIAFITFLFAEFFLIPRKKIQI